MFDEEGEEYESDCKKKEVGPGTYNTISGLESNTDYNFRVYVAESDETICKSTSTLSRTATCSTIS